LFFLSIKVSTPSIAVLSLSSYGVYLLFLGKIFEKHHPRGTDYLAVLCAILGNIILVGKPSLQGGTTIGVLLGLASGLLLAGLPLLHKRFKTVPDSSRALWQFGGGFLFFCLFAPVSDWQLNSMDWIYLILLGVLCTFVAHTLWLRITTRVSTATSSLIYYSMIPFAMLFSFLLTGEQMTVQKLCGAALIMVANLAGLYFQRED